MASLSTQDNPGYRLLPATVLLIAGLFLLLNPYEGLIHDSRLYVLQALNRLQPELYGTDVFLKFGSQDSFTLFTPLFAGLVSLLGVEYAASLLTLASILALLAAAWWLARNLMPGMIAWLALGLFAMVPTFYGEGLVFEVLETFITPRLAAEALVLFGLTAWLRHQRTKSIVLLAASFVIHPIMTFPAIVLLAVMAWGLPQWRSLWPLGLVAVFTTALALSGVIPLARWQFDEVWLPVTRWAPHLMLAQWTTMDWARIGTVVATLAFAARHLPQPSRQLALATLITTGLLLLLAGIGGDLLKIVIVVQGQAWRCLWIATTLAVLLLPSIGAHCWKGPPLQRCGLLLLVGSWVCGYQSLSLFFTIPALLMLSVDTRDVPRLLAMLTLRAAGVLLAVTLLCMVALTWSEGGGNLKAASDVVPWLQFLRTLCEDRILPIAVLLCAWYAATRTLSHAGAASLAALIALPATLIGAEAAEPWLRRQYPEQARAAFAPWRDVIPPGSDVLWSTRLISGSDPSAVWLLLERPSYFSSVQFNSGLFSREAAVAMLHRHRSIPLSLPTEQPVKITFAGDFIKPPVCADVPVRYVVADTRIADAKIIPAPGSAGPPFDRLELQVCP